MSKPDSRARDRTLLRMKNLIAVSTLVAGCKDNVASGCGGYAVVDPMPPPAQCPGLARESKAVATWKRGPAEGGGDGWIVEIVVTAPERGNAHFPEVSNADGASKVKSITIEKNSATYEVLPGVGMKSLYFSIPISCDPRDGGPASIGVLRLVLDVGNPGGPITTNVYDG